MEKDETQAGTRVRKAITLAFSWFEDVVYVGLGLMLAYSAASLLFTGGIDLVRSIGAGAPVSAIIGLLDRALLVLMIVELLYTVKVSFREHALLPEPFLVVGLIAVTRRILVVTAEFSQLVDRPADFQRAMIEEVVLTAMVLALVASLRMLRSKPPSPHEQGSTARP